MRDAWRHFIAEFIGTFALVFVGSASIIHSRTTGNPAGLLEVALAARTHTRGDGERADAHLRTFQSRGDAGAAGHAGESKR